mgnify:CR=1 FL=1
MYKMTELEKQRFLELTNENSMFCSKYPGEPSKGKVSIGYLDEFLEFLYLNPKIPLAIKLLNMNLVEKEIQTIIKLYQGHNNMLFNNNFYVPTMWSRLLTHQN